MTALTLALWQGATHANDPDATLAEIAAVARTAKAQGAALLVFPEGFLTGYHVPGLTGAALVWVERALRQVGQIAAELGLALVLGTHLVEGERLRNAAVVFSSSGAELGRYYKRILFGAWEKATFVPGTSPLRFAVGGLRVGVAICYDVEFPELIRDEALAGVDLVVVPTALMEPYERIARLMVPVRAMENQIFVGYANRSGTEPGLRFVGLSRICGPKGEVLAEAGESPALVLARIDTAACAAARTEGAYLQDLAERLAALEGLALTKPHVGSASPVG